MTKHIEPLAETEARDQASRDLSGARRESLADTAVAGAVGPERTVQSDPLASKGTSDPLLHPGSTSLLGRYVLLDHLGEGAMGVVFSAFDPKLERKVAIKLIRNVRRDDETSRRRMEREAQAMARLSHPNVVTVYEVGEFEGQLFLAMEFIRGRTLRDWLAGGEGTHDWRAIVRVFVQAGRGLAAAHRAGIVHRDFKPDNVFVGDDGRVRVGDFGLARGTGGEQEASAARMDHPMGASDDAARSNQLTMTGVRVGTPAYMAPEQFMGARSDARTDQFAFCVALWEALYDERPFAGESLGELIAHVTSGKLRRPPGTGSTPRWLRRIVERGLSSAREDRFPTTDAMLSALEADPTRRRRVLAGGVMIGLVAAGLLGAREYTEGREIAACEGAGESIDEVWSDEAEQNLREAMLATAVPYAKATAASVIPRLSRQASQWRVARTEACLNSRVREIWTESTADRATWCLDERRIELEAVVDRLSAGSVEATINAVAASAELSRVDECLDTHRLALQPPVPEDSPRVRAVLTTLAGIDALIATREIGEALERAREAGAMVDAIDWPPVTADWQYKSGFLKLHAGNLPEAEEDLKRAFFSAVEARVPLVAVEAASALAVAVGSHQARYAEGLLWARHAEALLTSLGVAATNLLWVDARNAAALVHKAAGDYEEAREIQQQNLSILEDSLGGEHPLVATTLNNLALVYESEGSLDAAMPLFERALSIDVTNLGDEHPDVAFSLNNLAFVHDAMGEYEKARELHEQALKLRESVLDPDSPDIAASLNNLAYVHMMMGEYAEASALYHRALRLAERIWGPEGLRVAQVLSNLGVVASHMGDGSGARELLSRALVIREAAMGPEHLDVAIVLHSLAHVELDDGQFEKAEELIGRALSIKERSLEEEHPRIANSLIVRGDIYLATGHYGEARGDFDRALSIYEGIADGGHPRVARALDGLARVALAGGRSADALAHAQRALEVRLENRAPEAERAASRFLLARALWSAGPGRDRERVVELARQSRDGFRTVEGQHAKLMEVETFLADVEQGG